MPNKAVSRIAIVNPYLLRGIHESSEMEAIQRFIVAAKNMGIDAAVFKSSQEVYDFDPDFVIPISHQEPKLTHYPTYGLFINPIQWVASSARFVRNVFTYDGYFAVSPHTVAWLQQICQTINKPLHVTNAAFSVPKTAFVPLDYSNASAAYMGVNWDGLRHFSLFQHLHNGQYIKCYGPKESWIKYPAELYGGMIPFDGFTALKIYGQHGIGLGINHPAMDNEGIPTCRTFEIPAASAIMICSENNYIKQHYGDSVLYVNHQVTTDELAEAIKEKIEWVRSNPKQASEMAKNAHDIFNRSLSLEFFIQNMIDMHHKVISENGYSIDIKQSHSSSIKPAKITYLIMANKLDQLKQTIDHLQQQTYPNLQTLILFDPVHIKQSDINTFLNSTTNALPYTGIECNGAVLQYLNDTQVEWFGLIQRDDILFNHHCQSLMKAYSNSTHNKTHESLALIFGNSLEHANQTELKDKIQDNSLLYVSSSTRVGNITPCGEIPIVAALFKLNPTMWSAWHQSDFRTPLRINYSTSADPVEVAIHSNEITCSVTCETERSVLIIDNATSLLNFPNNFEQVTGTLLVDERQRQKIEMDKSTSNMPIITHDQAYANYQGKIDRLLYQAAIPETNEQQYPYTVAILLRTKDRPGCLPRAIKSILNQTFKNWQLVIINDGGKKDILEKTIKPFIKDIGERLVIINNPNSLGMSRGLNLGIDASQSEYLVVHDDDDSWQPEFLMQTVKFLQDPSNADCCGVITHSLRILEEIQNDQFIEQARIDFNSNDNPFTRVSLYRILIQNTFPPISLLFKRSIIDKIGYFNEDLPVLNDWDFNIRCLFHFEIGVIPQHLANYHHRTNQQNSIYGNSIIATSNLCMQYETVIRNRALREAITSDSKNSMLGLCLAAGGQELFNLALPKKVDYLLQFAQQLPQWLQQQVQNPIAKELENMTKQYHDIQKKLDMLIKQYSFQ